MSEKNTQETYDKIPIGLIINPIAGMGGSVGLKGSDGEETLKKALEMGAKPQAHKRAKEFFHELRGLKSKLLIITVNGVMGGDIAREEGFSVEYVRDPELPDPTELFKTTAKHTIIAAKKIKERGAALLVFIGGDGTARNIYEAVGSDFPVLGIPGGVKIHSGVFATNPAAAGRLTLQYLWGEAQLREAEVMDIDEEEFRNNRVVARLYGYMTCPYVPTLIQSSKMGAPQTEDELENKRAIARWIIEEWEQNYPDWYYLIGPGTTTKAIADELGEDKTLLGVDLFYKKKLIARDLNEKQILENIKGKKVKLVVTVIGRQGFVFGRGNLQLTPAVLKEIGLKNIIIIATKYKVSTLPDGKLRVDTRDPEFDKEMEGYYRVLIGYGEYRIIQMVR